MKNTSEDKGDCGGVPRSEVAFEVQLYERQVGYNGTWRELFTDPATGTVWKLLLLRSFPFQGQETEAVKEWAGKFTAISSFTVWWRDLCSTLSAFEGFAAFQEYENDLLSEVEKLGVRVGALGRPSRSSGVCSWGISPTTPLWSSTRV
jgi:hypothetical protein